MDASQIAAIVISLCYFLVIGVESIHGRYSVASSAYPTHDHFFFFTYLFIYQFDYLFSCSSRLIFT